MRKQIAAANWKMNCTLQEGKELLKNILDAGITMDQNRQVVFAVPFPYLSSALQALTGHQGYDIAAQNCYHKPSGAYTGETSAEMLQSVGIHYCIVGHSERREYFNETDEQLAEKISLLFKEGITPVFCCGEPLAIREKNEQNEYVARQLEGALFHLPEADAGKLIIAYEPVWAIGTGKTATSGQAQEMHAFIRETLAKKFGESVAASIPLLYGGSVKPANAREIFSEKDVDGGLVGGASLSATDFIEIIKSLKIS